MSADVLRAAATTLREAAEGATQGPWVVASSRAGNLIEAVRDTVLDTDDVRCGSYCLGGSSTVSLADSDATYIALANPVFGLEVADWLESEAKIHEASIRFSAPADHHISERALAVARSIVGGDE